MTITTEAIAHLDPAQPAPRAHLLEEHLNEVGSLAASFGSAFGAAEWARLAGRWHDLGKYSAEFQNRIRRENGFAAHLEPDDAAVRDHSSAGAVHALRFGHAALPVALAIAGHHAGLADVQDLIKNRIPRTQPLYDATRRQNPPASILAGVLPPPPSFAQAPHDFELWTRLVFSALCDADFLDTERFYNAEKAALRGGGPPLAELSQRLESFLAEKESRAAPSEVNRVRAEVRKACIDASTHQRGAFSLCVPTGGGKTLAGLSFALRHAVTHGQRRVVIAIPFTSIIEQSAEVYRQALGEHAVLEHHSALGPSPANESPRSRIAAENWDAPVIVTTTVQLFQSLLSNRPSSCRKLHRLADSVIVLDEAQALRVGSLRPVLDVLRSLIAHHGVSVVISTATQPAWAKSAILPEGLSQVREIVPACLRAFERLRRVEVRWPQRTEPTSWPELAGQVAQDADVLAITHRRKDARSLCEELDVALGQESTFHLSALMCAEHRAQVLARVRQLKAQGRPVRLVSTQLVEAGVDVDFAIVYRAMAGLDAMAQAAGRCNREGLRPKGELRVYNAVTKPPPGVLTSGLEAARSLLAGDPSLDLFDPQVQLRYFGLLFNAQDLDDRKIQELRRSWSFKTVAEQFKLIDDDWSAPVVVPWDGAITAVEELRLLGPSRPRYRALQRFIVNAPRALVQKWVSSGAAVEIEGVIALAPLFGAAYDRRFGLIPEKVGVVDAGDLVVDG